MKTVTLDLLISVWKKILDDPDAKQALATLKKDGFALDHLMPHDARYPCWADWIALIPFLSNQPSRRQLHTAKSVRKHLPLVKIMRALVAKAGEPFCEIRLTTPKATYPGIHPDRIRELSSAADLLEEFLSWDWYTRSRNQRNSVIARLRWEIRQKTGAPHDRELGVLIYASFRAAEIKEDFYLDATVLDRIEKLEKEGRVKATSRLNALGKLGATLDPGRAQSTRFSRNRK